MAQGAICINHWVAPLDEDGEDGEDDEDDEDDEESDDGYTEKYTHKVGDERLQQLIIYWQYQYAHETSPPDEGGSTASQSRTIPLNSRERNETVVGSTAISTTQSAAAPTPSAHRRIKKGTAAQNNTEDDREPLFRSNVIVVFERSETHPSRKRSVALDKLSEAVSSGNIFVEANSRANMQKSKQSPNRSHGIHLVRSVIENICDSLAEDLNSKIDSYVERCAKLDREVYQKPEDDTIAPKLWLYSKRFQSVKKNVDTIRFLVDDIRSHLISEGLSEDFLKILLSRFNNFAYDVEEELRKPVVEMIDLVYKSVSIKDARLSLGLNESLWRLSWVTFIFLPLTFLVGFFGMNVDTFASDPSIKWYVTPNIYLSQRSSALLTCKGTSLLRFHSYVYHC
jgi:hypothetical protein